MWRLTRTETRPNYASLRNFVAFHFLSTFSDEKKRFVGKAAIPSSVTSKYKFCDKIHWNKYISFVCQFQILKDMIQEADADEKESLQLNLLKLNSTFMVKSENSRLYTPSILSRLPLEHKPSAFCPDSARHLSLITHLPLPAACPTCWSVQRIGKCFFLISVHLCKRRKKIRFRLSL